MGMMMSDLEATIVYRGGRHGAKKTLKRMGIDPYVASSALNQALVFGTYVYPLKVNGYIVDVACALRSGLLFDHYHYIVGVYR